MTALFVRSWQRAKLCLATAPAAVLPTASLAHDAFGDLGPFYAALLHPLADPLQAALVVGTAAFLAGQQDLYARLALPLFRAESCLAALVPAFGMKPALPALLGPGVAIGTGLAAMMPTVVPPCIAGLAPVAVTGMLTGLAPGLPDGDALRQWLGGTVSGIAVAAILTWSGLATLSRRLSSIAPKVAGS